MSFQSARKRLFEDLSNAAMCFGQNKTVRAITDGLINLIPLALIGSICLAISNLPLPSLHMFLDSITFGRWTLVAHIITFSTEDIIALAALLSIAFTLASQNSCIQKWEIGVFSPMLIAFICYVILMVWDPVSHGATPAGQTPPALFSNPGRDGVLTALLVAVVSVNIFIAFIKLMYKIPRVQERVVGSQQQLRLALRIVMPLLCTMLCFIALRLLLEKFLSATQAVEHLESALTRIVSEGSLSSVVISVVLMQVLWFFGAHGSQTIQSYMQHAGVRASSVSERSLSGGNLIEPLDPETIFVNDDFYSVFIDMGGSGTTIALLVALLIFGSVSRGRRLARYSVFPVAFNINETLIFGVPIVLNPFYIIPFILAPVISAVLAYGAFSLGIVPPMTHYVEWTTPILLSGYMSTGSLAGSLLQLLCVVLSFFIYTPFVLVAKKATEKHQVSLFAQFKKEASAAANNEQTSVANRYDDMGEIARDLITELHMIFEGKQVPFTLAYQPKSDAKGCVAGAEALLRWTHPLYGPIPPDVLIELADEAELSVPLGRWITTEALEELARWKQKSADDLILSINLNPHQIYHDHGFSEYLKREINRLALDPKYVELEITEHVAVRANETALKTFMRLKALGVHLSIDDMGVGYSSLTYISDFGVSAVKVDISLIDKIATDMQQQEIVRSIVELARQINLVVIIEGVETRAQVDALVSLGCHYFQGYHFSKPLPSSEFLAYLVAHGTVGLEPEGKR